MRWTHALDQVKIGVSLATAISLGLPSPVLSREASSSDSDQHHHLRAAQVQDDPNPQTNPTFAGLEEAMRRAGQEATSSVETPGSVTPARIAPPAPVVARTFWERRGQVISSHPIAPDSPRFAAGMEEDRNRLFQGVSKVEWVFGRALLSLAANLFGEDGFPREIREEEVHRLIDPLNYRELIGLRNGILAKTRSLDAEGYPIRRLSDLDVAEMILERLRSGPWEGNEKRLNSMMHLAADSSRPREERLSQVVQEVQLKDLTQVELNDLLDLYAEYPENEWREAGRKLDFSIADLIKAQLKTRSLWERLAEGSAKLFRKQKGKWAVLVRRLKPEDKERFLSKLTFPAKQHSHLFEVAEITFSEAGSVHKEEFILVLPSRPDFERAVAESFEAHLSRNVPGILYIGWRGEAMRYPLESGRILDWLEWAGRVSHLAILLYPNPPPEGESFGSVRSKAPSSETGASSPEDSLSTESIGGALPRGEGETDAQVEAARARFEELLKQHLARFQPDNLQSSGPTDSSRSFSELWGAGTLLDLLPEGLPIELLSYKALDRFAERVARYLQSHATGVVQETRPLNVEEIRRLQRVVSEIFRWASGLDRASQGFWTSQPYFTGDAPTALQEFAHQRVHRIRSQGREFRVEMHFLPVGKIYLMDIYGQVEAQERLLARVSYDFTYGEPNRLNVRSVYLDAQRLSGEAYREIFLWFVTNLQSGFPSGLWGNLFDSTGLGGTFPVVRQFELAESYAHEVEVSDSRAIEAPRPGRPTYLVEVQDGRIKEVLALGKALSSHGFDETPSSQTATSHSGVPLTVQVEFQATMEAFGRRIPVYFIQEVIEDGKPIFPDVAAFAAREGLFLFKDRLIQRINELVRRVEYLSGPAMSAEQRLLAQAYPERDVGNHFFIEDIIRDVTEDVVLHEADHYVRLIEGRSGESEQEEKEAYLAPVTLGSNRAAQLYLLLDQDPAREPHSTAVEKIRSDLSSALFHGTPGQFFNQEYPAAWIAATSNPVESVLHVLGRLYLESPLANRHEREGGKALDGTTPSPAGLEEVAEVSATAPVLQVPPALPTAIPASSTATLVPVTPVALPISFASVEEARSTVAPMAVGSLDRRQLEAAVERDVDRIALILKEQGVQGKVLLGLGPEALASHGPATVEFLDRLKAQVPAMDPVLLIVGKGASHYEDRGSVLIAREDVAGAVNALQMAQSLYDIERLEYMANPQEAELLTGKLDEQGIHLTVIPHAVESLPLILRQILNVLAGVNSALSQSSVDEAYGIDLYRLAEQLKRLAQIGV